ncbi:hypothetical protein SAMN05421805_101633 [Saccharopolyspora antimicrobica]|uniref:Uncharacterized protein n=1 Tax=Saccharopolyspora antimicrobica TaxID=455193 RepID=A0A1I4RNT2_9PSEU|nr:hypothetical protein [Saccharopolyspora antimicrobica]RKT87935.1 hypothetical protein ATL45_6358 [Saccharopolyspora antimicrobica]SFM53898.1 hypothetical protein SAMN05421805_101633 [Saccharopolyspora antimicrobica]
MNAVDHDVDEFGILDPPNLPENEPISLVMAPGPQSVAEETVHRSTISVAGNGNTTAQRDVDNSINMNFLGSEFAEVVLATARARQRFGRGLQDDEALERLETSYEPPPQLLGEEPGTAFRTLRDRRVLMITSVESEGGQFAAALRLGHELRKKHSGLVVREELFEQKLGLQAKSLLVEHEPAAVLVDLRWASDEDFDNVRHGLVEFTRQLDVPYQSYLILIVPEEQARKFENTLPGRMHWLQKPSSTDVFARYAGVPNPKSLLRGETEQVLNSLWPPRVKEIAEAVSDRYANGEDPEQALLAALNARSEAQIPELRTMISAHQEAGEAEWVALLVAASLLEEAPAQHIVSASDELMGNRAERVKVDPLLKPSPHTKLKELADCEFDVGTRTFQPRGSGLQILQHIWREHDALRPRMLKWLGELPSQIRDLSQNELEQLADRAAELTAQGGPSVAISLADAWAKTKGEKPDAYRRSIAVRLLTTTATDLSLGKPVRQKLWEWSRESNTDRQLLTAEVCAGIGQAFPRIALTRLKHLANAESGLVRGAVQLAVEQIGAELGASTFLRYLADWFDDASPARLLLMAKSVATVLKGRTLEVDADAAAAFWQRALESMPPDNLRPVVESWLSTAAEVAPDQRDALVEPLVAATNHDSRRIAQLQYASRFGRTYLDLSSLGGDLSDVVNQLWTRLDEVDPVRL